MKKNFMFAAALMLLAMAVSASAQKGTDFSGTWSLDLTKSKLSDREKASIESQSMTVTQTATDIKVETTTKRNAPPAGAPAGGPPPGGGGGGGRMGGGGMGGGGDAPTTYSLGKETKTEISGPQGAIPVTLNAKFDGAKLNLSRSSTFTSPMGEITSTTKETWELGADGKSLTINRESVSPRGTDTTTRVFTKN